MSDWASVITSSSSWSVCGLAKGLRGFPTCFLVTTLRARFSSIFVLTAIWKWRKSICDKLLLSYNYCYSQRIQSHITDIFLSSDSCSWVYSLYSILCRHDVSLCYYTARYYTLSNIWQITWTIAASPTLEQCLLIVSRKSLRSDIEASLIWALIVGIVEHMCCVNLKRDILGRYVCSSCSSVFKAG